MDIIRNHSAFAQLVGAALAPQDAFTLVDIGCAGGLPHGWRSLAPRLKAFGFDPLADDLAALAEAEADPGVRYVPGLVSLGAPVREHYVSGNPWDRLAVKAWFDRKAPAAPAPARSSDEVIDLAQFLRGAGVTGVDFIKLDVDGPDLDLLRHLSEALGEFGVLAVGLEVNFIGGAGPDEHSFHNTDRLLRSLGFSLFNMSTRRYPAAALPAASALPYPADAAFGRLFQGDALYVRDVCAEPEAAPSPARLLKAAAIHALFDVPDCAAEILVRFRDRLEPLIDIDLGLDLLAAQAQDEPEGALSYPEYVLAFRQDASLFRSGQPFDREGFRAGVAKAIKPAALYADRERQVQGEARLEGDCVVTGPRRGTFALAFPRQPAEVEADARVLAQLEIDVEAGAVSAFIADARGQIVREVAVEAGKGPTRVTLTGPAAAHAGPIILRNAASTGEPSRAKVRLLATGVFPTDIGRPA
jgi:hypothetical protein